jgi:acetyl-CoA C-acetyltransferase
MSGVRTAIGDLCGALADFSPCELAARVAKEAIARAGMAPGDIGQSVFGNVVHTEPRDMYLSRVAALSAGVPVSAPALTLNRLCGSGLQAVITAAEQIMLGQAEVVLAGGAESMSRTGHLLPRIRAGVKMGDVTAIDMMLGALTCPFGNSHMGVTAETVAAEEGVHRARQDALALESHRRAALAIEEGRFAGQILPLERKVRGGTITVDRDEHVRPGLKLANLEELRPVFRKEGTVTAGNASGINDGAAALVLASGRRAAQAGAEPLGRIVAAGLGGVEPERMGLGPVPAVQQALARAGLGIADLAVIESNEAFAAQACAVAARLGFPPELTNPNGGAIALGHPIGASGAILMVKLLYELRRARGRFGLVTMCIGGGQGIALIVESVGVAG